MGSQSVPQQAGRALFQRGEEGGLEKLLGLLESFPAAQVRPPRLIGAVGPDWLSLAHHLQVGVHQRKGWGDGELVQQGGGDYLDAHEGQGCEGAVRGAGHALLTGRQGLPAAQAALGVEEKVPGAFSLADRQGRQGSGIQVSL